MAARWVPSAKQLGGDITNQTIVVLPLGATEQHGPHLPLETDTIIAKAISESVISQASTDGWQFVPPKSGFFDLRFLPVEEIGYSVEHMDHAGTRTLTYDQAINRWISIGETCADRGVKRFVMLNAHGGNSPLMTVVAQELRVLRSMLAVATSWTRFLRELDYLDKDELAFGIHGGKLETEIVSSVSDFADIGKAQNFDNLQRNLVQQFKYLRAYGPHAFGWKAADLNPHGVTGNAAKADTFEADEVLQDVGREICILLAEVADFDLTWFNDG